jgi:hypothetical protein
MSPKRALRGVYWLLFGDPAQRRRSLQECARIAASLFGDLTINQDQKRWREDSEFHADYEWLSLGNPYS